LRESLTERQDVALGQVQFHALNAMHRKKHYAGGESVTALDGRDQVIKRNQIDKVRTAVSKTYRVLQSDASYLFSHGVVSNEGYMSEGQTINVVTKTGQIVDIAQASDLPSIKAISKIVKKNYLCWPKNVSL